MSARYLVPRIFLWVLICVGLWSALSLSYTTLTGSAPCPDAAGFPVCYLVAIGYAAMLTAQVLPTAKFRHVVFFPAWVLVFLIAALGTGFELTVGNTCPRNSSGVPQCYFSLAFCIAIILLYLVSSDAGNRAGVNH